MIFNIPDVAARLEILGFVPRVDFRAVQAASGVDVEWLSAQPIPSEAEINAVDMTPGAVAARLTTAQRAAAVSKLDNVREAELKIARGIASVLVNVFNVVLGAMPRPIASITRSTTTATVTTPTAHGMTGTRTIGITGADVAAYNGAKSITVTGATTFTYTVAGSPATPAAGSIFYALDTAAPPLAYTFEQALTAVKNEINAGTAD